MPFLFTPAITAVCRDMAARLPEFTHINMGRVAVGFRQARTPGKYGVHASLTPLRFEGGAETKRIRGRLMTTPRIYNELGQECLYLLQFYLPRFMDEPLEEKLATIAHELWHISPQFDGDIRRFAGRCHAHGSSKEGFHQHATELARQWLALDPPTSLYAFLLRSTAELGAEWGGIVGTKYLVPKLVAG